MEDFDLVDVGIYGKVEVIPAVPDTARIRFPLSTLPLGLPPIQQSIEQQLEEYLLHPEKLPIHDVTGAHRFWPRVGNLENLLCLDPCPVQSTIQVDRDHSTGKLIGYKEEYIPDSGANAKNSTSLHRIPGPSGAQDVRGHPTNFPFWPGGLDEPDLSQLLKTDSQTEIEFDNDLLTCPPGFESGLSFAKNDAKLSSFTKSLPPIKTLENAVINLANFLTPDLDEFDLGDWDDEPNKEDATAKSGNEPVPGIKHSESLENLVTPDSKTDVPTPVTSATKVTEEVWAIQVDVNTPVADFHKRVPCMAHTWPFELDTFQKQAVIHLEKRDCVFVAAHTSAGKTVVAEYAIALSLRHLTRTVYTSPIKALSNQKFRDFRKTFGEENVGLITGDIQLNMAAPCLIMTTEILRSMLYNGSEVIRDLEWVIFDEVHYINDSERGVVWEEVIIMLPQHVNIIMLSATVPNAHEFADWVGRTKHKHMYVISTLKRPVPLEHYLYTGNSNKTSSELFVIVDSSRNFLQTGYKKACDAKKERQSKFSQSYGAKGHRGGNPTQDKNTWLSVIEMLKKKDKLPAVAFTFSKKRIEENIQHLKSIDLMMSQTEKSEVHMFIQKTIGKLKGTDKELPQVKQLSEILEKGLGIHHSGILPILKEVVEMLFQKGLVKVLFATETFAMGVNMPARTVMFDTVRKHDGIALRDLLPGEYIQMAGRAGRRGLDSTGTVIILCKGDVAPMADLYLMMLGKPKKLESQFRLTYSMILNLLRVEKLRVQDMMKRSFSEFSAQKEMVNLKESLERAGQRMAQIDDVMCHWCSPDLQKYYELCRNHHELTDSLRHTVMTHPNAVKSLSAGRVIIIDSPSHSNVLGVILQNSISSGNQRTYSVLITCEKADSSASSSATETSSVDSIPHVKPIQSRHLFMPSGQCWHRLIQVHSDSIAVITNRTLKTEADKIITDIKKRQQHRFKDDPPSKPVTVATQELLRLTEEFPSGPPPLHPINDLHLRDLDLINQFKQCEITEMSVQEYDCLKCPCFNEHFAQMNTNMSIKEEYQRLTYKLSEESLAMLPEYQEMLQSLKDLSFVDRFNAIQLKGRVACEISNHELCITELIFENALTELLPSEIAAVLSCFVFEQKRCSEPNLSETLQKCKDRVIEIADKLPIKNYSEQLSFGLMEVVFEWARGMPFAEITELTDVQEGIIVRCIQRLHETLRDVKDASRIIGDPVLYKKVEEGATLIKRDIVFAASLYTQ